MADTDNNRIQKFDSNGIFITKWGLPGSGDGEFNEPRGVAVDSGGNVYVTDNNNRVQKFDSNGTFITKWGEYGTEDGEFNATSGVAVDSAGNVFVTDWWNNRIQKFGLTTELTYNVIRLTDNDRYDGAARLNAQGDVVWVGRDGAPDWDGEVFLYERSTGTTIQLTDNIFNERMAMINDSGDVIWLINEPWNTNDGVFLYERSTGTTYQITDNSANWAFVNNSGDIVWSAMVAAPNSEIFLYDRSINTTIQLTNNALPDKQPNINNNGDVIWHRYDGMDDEIFLYIRSSGTTIQLTDNLYDDRNARISDTGDVVWYCYDGTDDEIFLYDRSTGTTIQLTNNAFDDTAPDINDNGDVVWQGFNVIDNEIFFYDRSTGTTIQLTDNIIEENYPQINNSGDIVWKAIEELNGNWDTDIILYDRSTGTTIKLTDDVWQAEGGGINDHGDVVWRAKDGDFEDYEIFLAILMENTPVGEDVVVTPSDQTTGEAPVTVTFQNVTESGTTSLITSSDGPPPSEYFELGNPPTYYEITTTAQYSGNISICIDYSDISYEDEDSLSLIHYTESGEEVVTITSHDKENDILCGQVDSLSFFTIVEPISTEQIEMLIENINDLVADGKLNKGQGNALIAKLNAVIKNLNKGKKKTACNELRAFLNQVEAFIKSGILTKEEGLSLIEIVKAKIIKIGY